jgi:hypothetical protein
MQQQNMQMMQNMTSNQLGQIGMAQYLPQIPMNSGMMTGIPNFGFMGTSGQLQRSASGQEKKKDD